MENFMAKRCSGVGEEEQRRRELEAVARVVPWGCLRVGDYDFGGWAQEKELRLPGYVYEWARESWKLRGLLMISQGDFEDLRSLLFCVLRGCATGMRCLRLGDGLGGYGGLRGS